MATVPISELIIVLHQCDNSLQQRYNFFMNRQKGGEDFIVWAWLFEYGLSSIYDIMTLPIPPFTHFCCSSAKEVQTSFESWKVGAASHFGLNLPPAESIHPENLSPFNVCTWKCRRQRKWTTDENVEEDKQTAYKRVLTLITHLYAVLASIHRGLLFCSRWI